MDPDNALTYYREQLEDVKAKAASMGYELKFHEDVGFRLDNEHVQTEVGYSLDGVNLFLDGVALGALVAEVEYEG